MTRSDRHPTLDDWLQWIHATMDAPSVRKMLDHLHSCPRCREDLPLLRQLRQANRFRHWKEAPDTVRMRAARLPRLPRTPPPPPRSRQMQWQPADIRGRTLVAAPEPATLNAVLENSELSIVAQRPEGDPYWQIEGRVWLRENRDRKIEIVLLHGDHVIAYRTVDDGEFFRIREILPRGWQLEVHLPDEQTLKLTDEEA